MTPRIARTILWCLALAISQPAFALSQRIDVIVIGVNPASAKKAADDLRSLLARDSKASSAQIALSAVAVDLAAPIGPQLDRIKNHLPALIYVTTPLIVSDVRKVFTQIPIVVSGVINIRPSEPQSSSFLNDKLVTGYLYQQTPLAKRISHLARLCTGITKIGYVTTREAKKTAKFEEFIENERSSLLKLGITIDVIFLDRPTEIEALAELIRTRRIDALDIVYSQFVTAHFDALLRSVKKAAIPYVFSLPQAVNRGAAFSVYTSMDAKDAKIAKIIAGLINGEPVHRFPVEIQTSQALAVRYNEFSKIKTCDADRAIRLATIRLQ